MMNRKLTNAEFGARVGCDQSFASYLRRGLRMPGTEMFIRIRREFDLDPDAMMDAYQDGPEVFSAFLRTHVFGGVADDPQSQETG